MPSYCETRGCLGHFGKFSDCLTEAMYEWSLNDGDSSTGDTDYDGHFTLIINPHPEVEFLREHEGDSATITPVEVPAGAYIVQSTSSGAIYLLKYDSDDDARAEYARLDKEYGEWLSQDEEFV